MVARSAGCEQQVLSTASLAASSNRDPHYVRLITDDATDFASKIRFSPKTELLQAVFFNGAGLFKRLLLLMFFLGEHIGSPLHLALLVRPVLMSY